MRFYVKLTRVISLLLVFVMVFGVAACNNDNEQVTETESTSDTASLVTSDSETEAPFDDLRVIIASDTHHSPLANGEKYYQVPNDVRMQRWVDAIKAEHEKDPIDLLIINGDVSFDHLFAQGTWTTQKVSTSKNFMEDYVSQLPKEIPYVVMPGNHEAYTNSAWTKIAGNERQATFAIKRNLFVMVDNFQNRIDPNYDTVNGAGYSVTDVDYVKAQMEKYPDHNVWIISHWLDESQETNEFKALMRDKRVKGAFVGHSHLNTVFSLSSSCAYKKVAQTGHFSYSGVVLNKEATVNDYVESFWGFRDLKITEDGAVSTYIIPAQKGVVIKNTSVDVPAQVVNKVKFY